VKSTALHLFFCGVMHYWLLLAEASDELIPRLLNTWRI
jgi:hypothetical protein